MWHLIKAVFRIGWRIILNYFSWILPYSGRNKDKYPIEKRYFKMRKLIKKVNKALDTEVIAYGLENIPDEVCCFFCNHLGAADPLPMIDAMEKPVAFLAKSEVKKMPFVGRIFTATNGLFLDRSNLKQQISMLIKMQESLSNREHNWFVFPEGTRNKDQMAKIQPFYYGTFRSAMAAGVPIVPVATFSSFRVLKSKHPFKKYPTFMSVLPPIYPEQYQGKTHEEIGLMVHHMIQKEVSFHLRIEDHKYNVKVNSEKGYRFNEVY